QYAPSCLRPEIHNARMLHDRNKRRRKVQLVFILLSSERAARLSANSGGGIPLGQPAVVFIYAERTPTGSHCYFCSFLEVTSINSGCSSSFDICASRDARGSSACGSLLREITSILSSSG